MDEHEKKQHIKATFNTVANGYDCPALRYFSESGRQLAAALKLNGAEHLAQIQALATDDGIWFDVDVLITAAHKA